VSLVIGVVFYFAGQDLSRIETGEKVPRVSWLPPAATNVSYYRSYLFTAYEFDVSESEFLKWAQGYDLKPVREPFSIPRYNFAAKALPPEDASEEDARRIWERASVRTATVNDGYFYEQERGRSGGFTRIAWDRTTSRAYFQSNPR